MTATWNEKRFHAGRENFRRRNVPRLSALFAILISGGSAMPLLLGGGFLWIIPGVMIGCAVAVFALLDDFAPEHLRRRQRGLLGELETRKVLRPLERQGWEIKHGIDVGKGDLDHLVVGPRGIYALETKTLLGVVTVENGVLVSRQEDDRDEVHRWTRLSGRMRSLAKAISGWVRSDADVRTWVQPVVVVWGAFEQRLVDTDGVVYIHGRDLIDWLRGRPLARAQVSIDTPT